MIEERILSQSMDLFPFPGVVARLLDCGTLDRLHEALPDGTVTVPLPPGQDQNTVFHRRFYQRARIDEEFLSLYLRFVTTLAAALMPGIDFVFQRMPNLRVQLPGGQAAGGRSHRDADYHHPDGEVNLLLALTPMFGTNTLFLESAPGRRDFRFIELHEGDLLVFDGRNCEHGNVPNTTGVTRVSLDFRILPSALHDDTSEARSVAYGLRFRVGEYYDRGVGCVHA
jgi:hypothetical protein